VVPRASRATRPEALGAGQVAGRLPAEILDLLPEGPPIAAPGIAGPGAPVAGVPRAWVAADVVRVQAGGIARESLAVLPGGVVPVSAGDAPCGAGVHRPLTVNPAAAPSV
jgi:hypothetical protein